jgi:hypothetical protein
MLFWCSLLGPLLIQYQSHIVLKQYAYRVRVKVGVGVEVGVGGKSQR